MATGIDARGRTRGVRGLFGRIVRGVVQALWPRQRLIWTREGVIYATFGVTLLGTGLFQQINLILLVAALAAGPVVSSIFVTTR